MRFGLFSSQRDAIREAFAEQHRRLTRRAWVAAGAALVVGGASGFWAASAKRTPLQPTSVQTDWLYGVVLGPAEDLRAQAMHVVAALERARDDDRLWLGFHRLVAIAQANPNDTILRTRLLGLCRISSCGHAQSAAQPLGR